MTIVLSKKTEVQLEVMKSQPPHAILLAGQQGVGLTTIARDLAKRDLAALIEPFNSKEEADHETGTISVTAIRRLYEQTRTKNALRQVYIIDNADRMSLGAQAAFLKLLEEPTASTQFILTSHVPQSLLPTVRSRLQTVIIEPISKEQTVAFIDQLGTKDAQTKRQLEYLASGLPAELVRLTENDTYFKERAEIMTDTRTFLAGSPYEQLLIVQKYYQNRAKALQLVASSLMVTRRSLAAHPQPNLIDKLDGLLKTQEKIAANCNIKLQLMTFVL